MTGGPVLVTAPFVRPVVREGERWLTRIDGGARRLAVRRTPVADWVLERMAPGRRAAELLGPGGPFPPDAVRASVAALRRAGLLVDAAAVSVGLPTLELELTNRCNADCVMCPRADLRPLADMSDATLDRVVELVAAVPLGGAILQGIGEPTLHPGLEDAVARLRRAFGPGRPIAIVTNGFTLTPERLGALRAAGVDHVQWSLHSLDAARSDAIFGVGRASRGRDRLEACARLHADALSINVVVMRANEGELPAIRRWAVERGIAADRVRAVPVFSRGGLVDTERLSPAPSAARGRCLYVAKSLFVASNGDLLPCSNDVRGRHAYTSVHDARAWDLLSRWRDHVLAAALDRDICLRCDHRLRDSLDTGWFERARGAPFGAAA